MGVYMNINFIPVLLCLFFNHNVYASGSITGGNTGDPAMARVERGRVLALSIIKHGDFFDGTFRKIDRDVASYFEASRSRLFSILSSQELDWKMNASASGNCITRSQTPTFRLQAHLGSCKNASKSGVAKLALSETLKANGLHQQDADNYASKVMNAWDAMEAWRIKNINPSGTLSDWQRKDLIIRGRLYAIANLSKLSPDNFPGGLVYPGMLTLRAKFVLSHQKALIDALKHTTLRWNWNTRQQTCAQVTQANGVKLIDMRESLCRDIVSLEDAAEILIHEAVHVIGIDSELEAIRTARSVVGGWDVVP